MKKLIISSILALFFSSCMKHYDKIEISKNDLPKLIESMKTISRALGKTKYDTLYSQISYFKSETDSIILQHPKINKDSLLKVYIDKYQTSSNDLNFKNRRCFSVSNFENELIYSIYDKPIANNRNLFEERMLKNQIYEFHLFSKKDRIEFIESVNNLIKNNIWYYENLNDYHENEFDKIQNNKSYCFSYSKYHYYIDKHADRYLVLKSDLNIDLNQYIILDETEDLYLLKNLE